MVNLLEIEVMIYTPYVGISSRKQICYLWPLNNVRTVRSFLVLEEIKGDTI